MIFLLVYKSYIAFKVYIFLFRQKFHFFEFFSVNLTLSFNRRFIPPKSQLSQAFMLYFQQFYPLTYTDKNISIWKFLIKAVLLQLIMLENRKQLKLDQPRLRPKDQVQPLYNFDGLNKSHIWAYAIGHILHDLTVTCWYNYLIYFLKKVLVLGIASEILLIAQVGDGIITPVIGYFSGKVNSRIGQRMPWYIVGFIFIFITNILLYSGFKSQKGRIEELFYFTTVLFSCFGYSALQINHMSLVPALTCSRKRRDQLNNLRSLFTFANNFIVLVFGLLVFYFMDEKLLEYKIVPYSCAFVGVFASVYFVCKINQPQLTTICKQRQTQLKKLLQQQQKSALNDESPTCHAILPPREQDSISKFTLKTIQTTTLASQDVEPKTHLAIQCEKVEKPKQNVETESVLDWFKMPKFYLYGVCYVCAKFYVNLFGTLLPFYASDVLKMVENTEQKVSFNLALIPMLAYTGSLLASCKLDYLYEKIGRKHSLLLGTLLCVLCSTSMAFIDESHAKYFYGVVVIVGVSQSLVLSTAFTMISDVVATKEKSGAFVFGIYSMLEKFALGLCIFFVTGAEAFSKTQDLITESDRTFIKWTTILLPSIACLVGALILSVTSVNEYTIHENKISEESDKKSALQKELIL